MKLQSITPHDQSILGELQISTADDVARAVSKAKKAFETWQFTPIEERISYIKTFRERVQVHKHELAMLISQEMGKPLNQALGEIEMELPYIDYYIESGAENLKEEIVYQENTTTFKTTFEPYGVCVCIAPWNFPLIMFDSGVLPALIAGNTVVFKPSEFSSLSQKMCFDLLQETGIPEGVLNLVIGGGDVGGMLVDSPVDLVWFTGSTKVGQEIYKKCGEKFIKGLMEMGGNSAGIVFADADIDAAVESIYFSRFWCTGQICNAVKRLFVEKPIFDAFVDKLVEKLKTVTTGNPMDDKDLGPLVAQKQLKTLEEQVQDAVTKGATIKVGGKRPDQEDLKNGNYFEPTILTHVTLDMKVMTEEVFGPVLPAMPFETDEEALQLANNTVYGLANEVYTKDEKRAANFARKLQSGVVAINTFDYFKASCPFGGYKKSGIGREYGKIGMQEFAQVKMTAVNK